MENKYINRYHTFCKTLKNLEKSLTADPKADFVLEGTVLNFNLTFDIAWKVMKDILVKKMGILDFATGSPRETLQQAFTNRLMMIGGCRCCGTEISWRMTTMGVLRRRDFRISSRSIIR